MRNQPDLDMKISMHTQTVFVKNSDKISYLFLCNNILIYFYFFRQEKNKKCLLLFSQFFYNHFAKIKKGV